MPLQFPLSAAQDFLLQEVSKQSRKDLHRKMKAMGLTKDEQKECRRVANKIRGDGLTTIVVNMDLRRRVHKDTVAESLLRTGRVLNSFEVETALGIQDDFKVRQRLLKEYRIYGGSARIETVFAHLPDDEHPIYGMMDYFHNPFLMRGTYYGLYRLTLKPEFLERSTFTPCDSYGSDSSQVCCWESIEVVLADRPHPMSSDRWYSCVDTGKVPRERLSEPAYIEAQVLGPIHMSDIVSIHVPCHDQLDSWFWGVLTNLGEKYGTAIISY
jgi:hypothetical protein